MTIEIHELDITDGLNKMLYDELKAENEELLKKIDKLEKENWCLKEFLKVLANFDTVYRSEIKNVIKELDK